MQKLNLSNPLNLTHTYENVIEKVKEEEDEYILSERTHITHINKNGPGSSRVIDQKPIFPDKNLYPA
jgi:hypothetical protein